MEQQINQFRILKGHSTINSPNECGSDVLNIFVQHRLKSSNFYRLYELISAFATQKFCWF